MLDTTPDESLLIRAGDKSADTTFDGDKSADTTLDVNESADNTLDQDTLPVLPSPVVTIKKLPILPPNYFLKESIGDKMRNVHVAGGVQLCPGVSEPSAQDPDVILIETGP